MLETVSNPLFLIGVLNAILLVVVLARMGRDKGVDASPITTRLDGISAGNDGLERRVIEQFGQNREEASRRAGELRNEVQTRFDQLGSGIGGRMTEISQLQKEQLETFSDRLNENLKASGQRLETMTEALDKQNEALRAKLDDKLKELREDNGKKLDQMRETVEEKLQDTLTKRLGESFKQVGERLEQVHKGLGEMQTLAADVGDLQRVLTNVKTRGVWGEIQLGALLADILTTGQYEANAAVRDHGNERVEFAIRLPGKDDDGGNVLLPIDAKFPKEAHERLIDAAEAANADAVEAAAKQLENDIKQSAKSIRDKYINPPRTTDFAFMYLPTESLYAEAARRPDLIETVQRDFRVVIAGPATFAALLNGLQMGFRTLAIQKRSSEVWKVLGAVKAEFGKFGDTLGKVKKKLQEASNHMENVDVRTRQLDKSLRKVEELPQPGADDLLKLSAFDDSDADGANADGEGALREG